MVRQHNRTETRNCGQTHFSGDESACLGWQSVVAVYNWQDLFPSRYSLPQPLGKGRETYKHVHSGDKGPHGKSRELIKDRCGLISPRGWENPCWWKEWWKSLSGMVEIPADGSVKGEGWKHIPLLVGQWRHLTQKVAQSYHPLLTSHDPILSQQFNSNIQTLGHGMLHVP